jgi:hypothetical protein
MAGRYVDAGMELLRKFELTLDLNMYHTVGNEIYCYTGHVVYMWMAWEGHVVGMWWACSRVNVCSIGATFSRLSSMRMTQITKKSLKQHTCKENLTSHCLSFM